jgi:hypothetical protein
LVIAEILEWRDFPDEKWLEWDEASHTSLAPQEQDRWFERWEDPEERFRDPPNWPGLEWEPYEGYLAEVYKPYGMRLKNMSMGEVCGNLDCFHLAASPDLENSSLLLSLLPQEEVEQPPAIPSDWRNAHSLSELRRIAESMDSAELPPELLEKAKEYILRLTPIVVRGDSVKLTPWETTPAQPINSKPRVLKPSGDISDIPKTKDNDITNQTGELINPYSLQSAANAVCFWVNHGAITPEDIPSQHLNTWKCSPHEGQSPDVSDLEAICSIVQADITDWDRMPGHWISKVADICQFKAHDPPCRPIAGYGTREELEAGQADDISVACALAQFIAPGMVTDANRDIWIHNASAHMAFALIQEGLLKADDFDDFVEHEAIVCDIILLIAAGMACWRDTPTTRDLWMYARFARCVRLLCRQKQFDPSDVPPALRQHWGQIADPRQIADLIRANLLNADDIPQSRKDGWRESCLEIDLAQLVDVGVLAIDELADDIKSRLTKPIDVVIADLAGILPENWPGLLPADCDSVRRELQSTSKLRTLLENWEVDLPAELFDKITKNPPTREQSDRTDGDKSTKKTKSRRRKKQTNQKIKTKEMILLGAIMAYHQFGSEKENLIPTSQTILGEVAGGMTQSDVSRTMKRLFGENPSKGYKRILREPNPLEGFIKKGELLGIPNDVEAPYYRPSHPTEAEERQSENT